MTFRSDLKWWPVAYSVALDGRYGSVTLSGADWVWKVEDERGWLAGGSELTCDAALARATQSLLTPRWDDTVAVVASNW